MIYKNTAPEKNGNGIFHLICKDFFTFSAEYRENGEGYPSESETNAFLFGEFRGMVGDGNAKEILCAQTAELLVILVYRISAKEHSPF